jgi:hypothetical protein
MSDKEKRYHWMNVIVIPVTVLFGTILAAMGHMADANQISMSDPAMSAASLLLFGLGGLGVIWIFVSAFINHNIRALVTKSAKGMFRSFVGIAALLVILIVLSFLIFPWVILVAVLAAYLLTTSSKALIANFVTLG